MQDEPSGTTTRRAFLGTAAAPVLAAPALALGQGDPSMRLRVAVLGLSRGIGHIRALAKVPGVEIAAVCDVDSQRLAKGAADAEKATGKKPQAVGDFRKILEDTEIDALTIALPNFWHTPLSVLACEAGKHVYVEKPGSYCARESELIVAAARKHDRRVQMGNQRRSQEALAEAVQQLREGAIGMLRSARTYYSNARRSIGRGTPAAVPEHLDYELWQGPTPRRPYKSNLIHYNWHWHWHWGNGELGNNGVHALDVARWALGVSLPISSTCHGGRYHHDDDQETPDTTVATYDFGDTFMSWEGSSCHRRTADALPFVEVYGDGGCMKIDGRAGYQILDAAGKEIGGRKGDFSDVPHFQNFADAIREGSELNAEIEDAQRSALLCHLGNISYRTGKAVTMPMEEGEAMPEHWARQYAEGWSLE